MVPVALAVAASIPALRTRLLALGVVAGAAEAGAVLGPLYGGAILELAGWRAVFWVNLPLTAALVARRAPCSSPRDARRRPRGRLARRAARRPRASRADDRRSRARASTCLGRAPRSHLPRRSLLAAAFVRRSVRVASPLLPPALFRRAAFAAANAANLFVGAALVVALVQVPLFAAAVLDRSPAEGGLLLLRLTALIPVGALAGGWLAGRVPPRAVAAAGMLVSAAGSSALLLGRRTRASSR